MNNLLCSSLNSIHKILFYLIKYDGSNNEGNQHEQDTIN